MSEFLAEYGDMPKTWQRYTGNDDTDCSSHSFIFRSHSQPERTSWPGLYIYALVYSCSSIPAPPLPIEVE